MPVLHLKRRLRAVEGCPQPEPKPYKPIVYGQGPWPARLPPCPTADQLTIRVRAQSLESKNGKVGPLRSYEEALEIIAAHERGEL